MKKIRPRRAVQARAVTAFMAGTAVVGGLVAGCSGSSDSGPQTLGPTDVAERYGYDATTATLTPVYALIPGYHDPRDGYARDLLARQCLQGTVDFTVVEPSPTSTSAEARTGQPAFDEQTAAASGYPGLRAVPTMQGGVAPGVTMTPELQEAITACGAATQERLGNPPEREPSAIESAGWNAVTTDPDVAAATSAWKTCMAPAGLTDLPTTPNEMPPASILELSMVKDAMGNLTPSTTTAVPDREREVAVLDAQCRASTDWTGAVFRARVNAELTAISKDVEGFEASRAAYDAYEKKLDAVITELG